MKKLLFFFISIPLTATLLFASGFTVTNNSDQAIKQLLASERDSGTWGQFSLGKPIAPGGSVDLQWDKSQDNADCNWSIKAVFADGSESEPAEFDFCEDDLEIEFE